MTKKGLEALTKLEPLTERSDLLLAALIYQEYDVFEEERGLFEWLVKACPEESPFHAELASYFERIDRSEAAMESLARAKKPLFEVRSPKEQTCWAGSAKNEQEKSPGSLELEPTGTDLQHRTIKEA